LLGTLVYAYDANGQRRQVGGTWSRADLPPVLAAASYDAANRQQTFDSLNLTYDHNGNVISDGTNTYTWNARNQLMAVTGPVLASFVYDGTGRRIAKTIANASTQCLYDGLNPVLLRAVSGTSGMLTGPGVDEYFTRRDDFDNQHVLVEAIGSTVALTDASGTVLSEYTYEPFGATRTTGAATQSTFDYAGREDDGTSLKYYRARYYNPRLHRFLSEDSGSAIRGGTTDYAYASNSPLTYGDPLGLLTSGFQLNFSGGAGVGFGFTLAIVADTQGQIGFSFTGGAGSYGGVGASGTFGAQFSTAKTTQDLRGSGAATAVTAGEFVVGEAGYFVGKGYQGGSLGVGLGLGTPVSMTGFITGTGVVCVALCLDSEPEPPTPSSPPTPPVAITSTPPAGPAPPPTPTPSEGCGRKC
jgi:RHS repeat-associated protein